MKRLAGLGAVAGLMVGASLIWLGAAPSQVGPKLAPVASPLPTAVPGRGAAATTTPSSRCPDDPGVPVSITVDGAHAQNTPVEEHGLGDTEDGQVFGGSLYVPPDPTHASWLNYTDVGPGADHGTAVFTSHVNYAHVLGAFADLTTYQPGQRISVTLQDGRTLRYHVVPAASMGFDTPATALEVSKTQLDADPTLNTQIFDFTESWSDNGGPACGRLVLVTCSGQVIDHNYLDNAFVFALPDDTLTGQTRVEATGQAPAR